MAVSDRLERQDASRLAKTNLLGSGGGLLGGSGSLLSSSGGLLGRSGSLLGNGSGGLLRSWVRNYTSV